MVIAEEQSVYLDTLIDEGIYSEALTLALSEKDRIRNEFGDKSEEISDIYIRLGVIYQETGRFNDSIYAFKKSASVLEELYGVNHQFITTPLFLLAISYHKIAQDFMALEVNRRALRITESFYGLSHPKVADILNHMGLSYMSLNRYDDAYSSYRKALHIHEQMSSPDHYSIALILLNLGSYYHATSQLNTSFDFYMRSLEIYKEYGENGENRIPIVLNNIALHHMALGEYKKAHGVYSEAFKITKERKGEGHPDVALILSNMGEVYYYSDMPQKRVDVYQKALRIYKSWYGHDHPKVALVLANLGHSFMILEHYDQALSMLQESLTIYMKIYGSYHSNTINTHILLGDIYRKRGQFDDAVRIYNRAYMMVDNDEPFAMASITNKLCTIFVGLNIGELTGDYLRRSIFFCKKSLNSLQKIRDINIDINKLSMDSFIIKHNDQYLGFVFVMLGMNRISEAQQVIAMIREDEFANFNKSDRLKFTNIPLTYSQFDVYEKKWDEQISLIKEDARSLISQIVEIEDIDSNDITSVNLKNLTDLRSRLLLLEESYYDMYSDMGTNFSSSTEYIKPIVTDTTVHLYDLLKKQDALSYGKSALIQTFMIEHLLIYVITTSDGKLIREYAIIDQNLLKKGVQDLLEKLSDPENYVNSISNNLYNIIIRPIEKHIQDKSTIIWAHDGFLRYIPMSVLYDGERFMIERFNMFRYTSAVHASTNDDQSDSWMIQGFGVSKASGKLMLNDQSIEYPALPAIRQELDSIVLESGNSSDSTGEIAGEIFLDSIFTRKSLQHALSKKPTVVHIASHFTLMDNIYDSHLLIGGVDTDESNRLLSLDEIRRDIDLSGVDLLTLSACKTGQMEEDQNGLEIEGLGVVAQEKGAKAVLATLWSVSDQSTSNFMQNFYRLWNRNQLSKSEAVRAAQIGMIKGGMVPVHDKTTSRGWSLTRGIQSIIEFDNQSKASANKYNHPYYWAPFILMGNGL